jgi:Ca2+:H+ antiporter
LLSGIGLVPLAQLAAELLDILIAQVREKLGGLLSITLGNLLELVIAITALRSGLYGLVVISIAGAVITNFLLLLGICIVVAGRDKLRITLQRHSRILSTNQLLTSVNFLSTPLVFYRTSAAPIQVGSSHFDGFALYSAMVAVLVLGSYILGYVIQLGTHLRNQVISFCSLCCRC